LKRDRQPDKYLNDFVRKNSFRFVFSYILYTYWLDLLALNMDNSLDILISKGDPYSAFQIPHSHFPLPHSTFRIPTSQFRLPLPLSSVAG
jgi:hypothetical protein